MGSPFNMSNVNESAKSIKLSHLLNIVLLITLVGTIIFGYFYYKQLSITDAVKQKVDVSKGYDMPEYLYTIYGVGEDRLLFPSSTYVDEQDVFVVDTLNTRVLVFDYNGRFRYAIGDKSAKKSIFSQPRELTIFNNRLYVTDPYKRKVFILARNGELLGNFAEKELKMPNSICFKDGRFYIIDTGDHYVKVFDTQGKLLLKFGGAGQEKGKFRNPMGINVDELGRIYVADSNNYRVQVFDSTGKVVSVWEGKGAEKVGGYIIPRGISFDKKGYVWIANSLASGVSASDKDGNRLYMLRTGESEGDQLALPTSTFIDKNNRLYVTAYGGHRVLVYQLN